MLQQDVCISVSISKCFDIKHTKTVLPFWTGVWLGSSWKSKVKPCIWRVHTSFSCLPLSFSIHYPLSFSMFLPPIITIGLFILMARWRSQVTFLELAFQKLAYWTKCSQIEGKKLICFFFFLSLMIFWELAGEIECETRPSILCVTQLRAFMPVTIEKDLVRCYRCLTHSQTNSRI